MIHLRQAQVLLWRCYQKALPPLVPFGPLLLKGQMCKVLDGILAVQLSLSCSILSYISRLLLTCWCQSSLVLDACAILPAGPSRTFIRQFCILIHSLFMQLSAILLTCFRLSCMEAHQVLSELGQVIVAEYAAGPVLGCSDHFVAD